MTGDRGTKKKRLTSKAKDPVLIITVGTFGPFLPSAAAGKAEGFQSYR